MRRPYYQVGDVRCYNAYEALREYQRTGHFNEYVMGNSDQYNADAICAVDVQDAIKHPVSFWIDRKLDWLIDTHGDRLRLHYSGGTDSQTILAKAMDRGYKFPMIWHCSRALINPEYTDLDTIQGMHFLQAHPDVAEWTCIRRLTIEDFEVWLEDDMYVRYPEFHFCFAPTWTGFTKRTVDWDDNLINVTGNGKPDYYKKNGKYYCLYYDNVDTARGQEPQVSFYSDGYVPELAVAQMYAGKDFFERLHPDYNNGPLTLHKVPSDQRKDYHACLGRHPALTKNVEQGTLVGKTPGLTLKHKRAMEEVVASGRLDIVEGWDRNRLALIKEFKDMEHGISLHSCKLPDNWRNGEEVLMPAPINRIGIAFRLDEDQVTRVDPSEIFG